MLKLFVYVSMCMYVQVEVNVPAAEDLIIQGMISSSSSDVVVV